jgi:hypothetical protein
MILLPARYPAPAGRGANTAVGCDRVSRVYRRVVIYSHGMLPAAGSWESSHPSDGLPAWRSASPLPSSAAAARTRRGRVALTGRPLSLRGLATFRPPLLQRRPSFCPAGGRLSSSPAGRGRGLRQPLLRLGNGCSQARATPPHRASAAARDATSRGCAYPRLRCGQHDPLAGRAR